VREALKLPNKTHPDSPVGGEEQNQLLREVGVKPEFDFEPLSHLDLAQEHNLLDFQNAGKLTGSKFVFLKNEAALLELALTSWAMQELVQH